MASLSSIPVIPHLLRSPSPLIKVTLLKISLMEDNVRLLIPILTTLVQIGAEEETTISEAEVVVISSNFVVVEMAVITIIIMAIELLQRISISLQVQMLMARRRRSVVQTLLVSHPMALIMKRVTTKLMMLMKRLVLLLCLVLIHPSMFVLSGRVVLLANV